MLYPFVKGNFELMGSQLYIFDCKMSGCQGTSTDFPLKKTKQGFLKKLRLDSQIPYIVSILHFILLEQNSRSPLYGSHCACVGICIF